MSFSSKINNSTLNQIESRHIFPIKSRSVVIIFILLILIALIILGVTVSFVPSISNFEEPIIEPILDIFIYVCLCYYVWKKLRQSQLNPQYLIGNKFPRYRWWSLLRLVSQLFVFSRGVAILSNYALSSFAPNLLELLLEEPQVSSLPIIYKCLKTISWVVVVPITVEFVFRGVLLHRLATKWNIAIAIWISSIISGLLHPFGPIGGCLLGVVMALLYIKTKTLAVPIVAHAMINTIAVIILVLGNNNTIASTTDGWIKGLLLVAVTLPFLIHFIHRCFPTNDRPLPYFANEAKASDQNI